MYDLSFMLGPHLCY